MSLDTELQTFSAKLPELLVQQGRYVLIKGADVLGTFDSYEDALDDGYAKFGLAPFLVKLIAPAERVAYFTRDPGVECQA